MGMFNGDETAGLKSSSTGERTPTYFEFLILVIYFYNMMGILACVLCHVRFVYMLFIRQNYKTTEYWLCCRCCLTLALWLRLWQRLANEKRADCEPTARQHGHIPKTPPFFVKFCVTNCKWSVFKSLCKTEAVRRWRVLATKDEDRAEITETKMESFFPDNMASPQTDCSRFSTH